MSHEYTLFSESCLHRIQIPCDHGGSIYKKNKYYPIKSFILIKIISPNTSHESQRFYLIKPIFFGKVSVIQNYSGFYFSLKHTSLDAVFSADYEYALIFLIWQNFSRENCKTLSRCQNLQKSLPLKNRRSVL
jgi:hypothetical protein